MVNIQNKYISRVIEVDGELCLVFPKEFINASGWKAGDQVVFEIIDKDNFKIYKKD